MEIHIIENYKIVPKKNHKKSSKSFFDSTLINNGLFFTPNNMTTHTKVVLYQSSNVKEIL
jgi:hypothetical protein